MFNNNRNQRNASNSVKKNSKGMWEYMTPEQVSKNPNQEEIIKSQLTQGKKFDIDKIEDYLNPQVSLYDKLTKKLNDGKKLSKAEKIQLDNILTKEKVKFEKDKDQIKILKHKAKVETLNGRKLKLLVNIKFFMEKNNIDKLVHSFLKLKDPEFEMDDKIFEEIKSDEDLNREFSDLLPTVKDIVDKIDIIKFQMTKGHGGQPPLNNKSFTKLDDWQKDIITLIKDNKSVIVSAPTSAGKSVISGAVFQDKSRFVIVVVPTDPLAWQMASYIGNILNANIPLVTATRKSFDDKDNTIFEVVEKINNCRALVGTADELLTILPFIRKPDYMVFDEIHEISSSQGSSMEHIIKATKEIPFLALSATISNINRLHSWFSSINTSEIHKIEVNQRFFNLQKCYYNTEIDELVNIHPFSCVSVEDFKNRSILKKSLQLTPPDIWDFAIKLTEILGIEDLSPYQYFDENQRITLDDSNQYFNVLLQRCVDMYDGENIEKINGIINGYQNLEIPETNVNLYNMLKNLMETDKTPVIIFNISPTSLMNFVRKVAKQIDIMEDNDPECKEYYKSLDKKRKKYKTELKEYERNNKGDMNERQALKKRLNGEDVKEPEVVPDYHPHDKYVFNKNEGQIFSESEIQEWMVDLRYYFNNDGDRYHWLIVLLWRGIGVYIKGVPEQYLRLVQSFASNKKIHIVFSDESLVFGVSMPFRSSCILKNIEDKNILNPTTYQQMAGRAGRRGLDTQGNVISIGYSFSDVKDLMVSKIPEIEGANTLLNCPFISSVISEKKNTGYFDFRGLQFNYLSEKLNEETVNGWYQYLAHNFNDEWSFINDKSLAHNFMVWRLRSSQDCVAIPMILKEFISIFNRQEPTVEKNQIEASLFISHFVNVLDSEEWILDDGTEHVLPESRYLRTGNASLLKDYAENIQLDIPDKIDSKIYLSISNNKMLDLGSDLENDKLRKRMFEFFDKVKYFGHYLFHDKKGTVVILIGKLLTRIWWIIHDSSPLRKKY